jgi:hypothetical protein
MKARKRQRRIKRILDCELRIANCGRGRFDCGLRIADGGEKSLPIVARMITNRMPSSINEKAQISIEPKAIGVKMKREIRMSFMRVSNILVCLVVWPVWSFGLFGPLVL